MAIFTPRGLKIRLPINYCFALMARLYPNVDAFKILKTAEGFELIPSVLSFIMGIISLLLDLPPSQIVLNVIMASAFGCIITLSNFAYKIPVLPVIGKLYSYADGFGLYSAVIIVTGLIFSNWESIISYFIAKLLSGILNMIIESIYYYINYLTNKTSGVLFTAAEISFLNAYRWYAKKFGKSLDINISEHELEIENWKDVYFDFVTKWPEVARRFDNFIY